MINKRDMLFEIGVEELPAGYIRPAQESLIRFIRDYLQKEKLDFFGIKGYSTPRRLTVLISSIPEKQEDELTERLGPALSIAMNPDGSLTKAGQGFLGSCGVPREALEIKKTDKGEYLFARIDIKGQETIRILQKMLPEAIRKINFPKTMYWNSRNVTFARPIRWLLALYGKDIVDLEFDGVKSGNITYGNVLEKRANPLEIDDIARYEDLLADALVIVDREKRKEKIRTQLDNLASELDCLVKYDDDLLDEVTDIVEYPTAVMAKYNDLYLKLPERIINSTLAKNQKYFALYGREDQKLRSSFIFIANNHPDYAANTREGNERVVKARLDDAVFYYEEDLKKSIEYFNKRLEKSVFHASLGTISDKVERIGKISAFLAGMLSLEQHIRDKLRRAASISKFDLSTLMVAEKEFAGLQGYVGMNYAIRFGEDEEVARSIEEHYHPLSFTDRLPETLYGTIVSIADKIDTLCGIFGIGNIPTGSNDPFALRRAGNGIVRILYEKEMPVDLTALIDFAYSLVNPRLQEPDNNKNELISFFKQRIEWLLEQNGIDYDIINAVRVTGFTSLIKTKRRVESLQQLRVREDFENLVLSFKRVSNIIAQEKGGKKSKDDDRQVEISDEIPEIDTALLQEEEERTLYQVLLDIEKEVEPLLEDDNYTALVERFIAAKSRIDLFFDKVLVNADDPGLRRNRYAILKRIRRVFLNIGDLSLIVIEGEK